MAQQNMTLTWFLFFVEVLCLYIDIIQCPPFGRGPSLLPVALANGQMAAFKQSEGRRETERSKDYGSRWRARDWLPFSLFHQHDCHMSNNWGSFILTCHMHRNNAWSFNFL